MSFDRHQDHERGQGQGEDFNASFDDAYGQHGGRMPDWRQGGGGGPGGCDMGPGGSNMEPGGSGEYNMGPNGYNMGPGGSGEYNMGSSPYNMGPGGPGNGSPDVYGYDGESSGSGMGPGGSQTYNNFYANGNNYNYEGQGGQGGPGGGGSSSDLLLNKALSDPSMYSVLQNAQSQMSAQGFNQFEHLATRALRMDPYMPDSQLLSGIATQMQQSGDSQDASVLASYANPGALSTAASYTTDVPPSTTGTPSSSGPYTDSYIQSIQGSDPQLAQALSDANAALSPSAFQQLETYVQQNAGSSTPDATVLQNFAGQLQQNGDPNDATALQAVIEADLPSTTANPGGTQTASAETSTQPESATVATASGAPGTTDALAATAPATSESLAPTSPSTSPEAPATGSSTPDAYVTQLEQTDPNLASALMVAQSNMSSPQAYQQLESFVQQYQGQTDDNTLLTTYASQIQSSDPTDASLVQQIAQAYVPATSSSTDAATTAATTASPETSTATSGTASPETSTATSGTASPDAYVTQLAQTDPNLANALYTAQTNMSSPQAYQQLEAFVQQYQGQTDDNTLLMTYASQIQSSDPTDASMLQQIAQTYVPATSSSTDAATTAATTASPETSTATSGTATSGTATSGTATPDAYVTQLAQTDPNLANALYTAQTNMSSPQAYQQLESFVQQYQGQTDDNTLLMTYASQIQSSDPTDASLVQQIAQAYAPSQSASTGATTTAATTASPETSTATSGTATPDAYVTQLAQTDPNLANALYTAQTNMSSPQAYQQLEAFVQQYQGQTDDNTLLMTYASQIQTSDPTNAALVQQIAQADVPAQSTATTTASTSTAGTAATTSPLTSAAA